MTPPQRTAPRYSEKEPEYLTVAIQHWRAPALHRITSHLSEKVRRRSTHTQKLTQ